MKYFILGISCVVMAGQIAGLIFYQFPAKQEEVPISRSVSDSPETAVTEEQPLYSKDMIDYSLQNDQLKVTYDHGESWIPVPVEKESLFGGEYNGNQQELIDNSYVLTEKRAAFLYPVGESPEGQKIKVTYSLDQGRSWETAIVAEQYPPIRFRKVAFLNDQFGYVIISGDRTMSQETSSVFLTNDGGKSWREVNSSNVTRLIADGGFIDEQTGFLSFGILNPEHPELHVTQDGGETWTKAEIHIPEQFEKIFVIAETPFKEGSTLAMLVNQGPSGDYKGGKVKGKFLSDDNGKTWEFSTEVQAIE
ncbi:WD40/YVTN/BNR-like repeat-containing protein [Siminovitchia sp. 179-K 8D1 HS]|uniref:WD40/YVTN/BNR-like repeat-containing protein n=1 Tax=Siminovitchia sp. 179-K 8D1 HS TaxID=3142385 RepID=UPI0039A078CD